MSRRASSLLPLAGTGLGFPTGDEAGVGLGGVVLGGGIGVLARQMGVGCDNLIAVEMVVPSDGAAHVSCGPRTRSTTQICSGLVRGGGGGNFGVTTSYTLQLHPMPDPVTTWQVNWSFDALHEAFGRRGRTGHLTPIEGSARRSWC